MTLTMGLRYKNPDASADINLRLKDVANKGFVAGGEVTPVPGVLQVNVAPFVCVNYDGAIVRSDANVVLNPGDGIVNVVFLRARYVLMGSPVMQVGIAPVGTYLIDPEFDWLTVLAIVDLTAGAPHSAVAPSEILYSWTDGANTVNRHAVDPQGRSFYRDPVENSGVLFTPGSPYLPPLADNRHGDVRLALDTGSFYWWNESGGLWEVFDEVPLNMHREHEHTNGITGDSDPTTLNPSISGGNTVNIAAVPPGSGYTVNGRYKTTPTPMPFAQNIAGDPKFSQRGLIQASSSQLGVLSLDNGVIGDYRVKLNAGDALSISAARIVDLSDSHPIGSFTLLYQPGVGLSWDDGEPVDVGSGTATGGTYRLYTPDYANWVDVRLSSGALLPGVAIDIYEVMASKKDDENFLIAYFFWNGTTLTDVTDKRYFGNLGTQELSDEFKATLPPAWNDLRGSMVYSGGDCSDASPLSLDLRVAGPLVAYIQGHRHIVPLVFSGQFGHTGITLAPSSTSYVYVNENGQLQVSATDPATTGLPFAGIAEVVTNATEITTITDLRDPQLIVGQATRNADVVLSTDSKLRWRQAQAKLDVEQASSTSGTALEVGRLVLADGELESPVTITISDANTPSPQALTSPTAGDLAPLVGLDTNASVIDVLTNTQQAILGGPGVTTGCAITFGANSVVIGAGQFRDFYGSFVTLNSPVTVDFTGAASTTHVVIYRKGAFQRVTHSTGANWRTDMAFALVDRFSGSNTSVLRVVPFASGNDMRENITLGPNHGPSSSGRANFPSVQSALGFLIAFSNNSTGANLITPKRLKVVRDFADTSTFDLTSDVISGALTTDQIRQRLGGLLFEGDGSADVSTSKCTLSFGQVGVALTLPYLNLGGLLNNIEFRNLGIRYIGAANVADRNVCFIRDGGIGLAFSDCRFLRLGAGGLTHLAYFTGATFFLGGGVTPDGPLSFNRCIFSNALTALGSWVHFVEAVNIDNIVLNNCTYAFNASAPRAFYTQEFVGPSSFVTIEVAGGSIGFISTAFIDVPAGWQGTARFKNVTVCETLPAFIREAGDISATGNFGLVVSGAVFTSVGSLNGAGVSTFEGCTKESTLAHSIVGRDYNQFIGCNGLRITGNGFRVIGGNVDMDTATATSPLSATLGASVSVDGTPTNHLFRAIHNDGGLAALSLADFYDLVSHNLFANWIVQGGKLSTRIFGISGVGSTYFDNQILVRQTVAFINRQLIDSRTEAVVDVVTNANWISGTAPATAQWAYVYMRKSTPGRSETSALADQGVIRLSPTPPQFTSQPFNRLGDAASPEAGFTRNGYICLGSFYMTVNAGVRRVVAFHRSGDSVLVDTNDSSLSSASGILLGGKVADFGASKIDSADPPGAGSLGFTPYISNIDIPTTPGDAGSGLPATTNRAILSVVGAAHIIVGAESGVGEFWSTTRGAYVEVSFLNGDNAVNGRDLFARINTMFPVPVTSGVAGSFTRFCIPDSPVSLVYAPTGLRFSVLRRVIEVIGSNSFTTNSMVLEVFRHGYYENLNEMSFLATRSVIKRSQPS